MATTSTIAIELHDGTIQMINCHWDGYLEHNGKLLNKFWYQYDKILQLMALGNLSRLGQEIGQQHDFQHPHPQWCLAYGRDGGEQNCQCQVYDNYNQYQHEAKFAEYNYVFLKDQWLVFQQTMKVGYLSTALDLLTKESLK
jgi:hypothetical protein